MFKVANNAIGVLAAGISAADTTLSLMAGQGAKFPELGPGDWFPITLVQAADPSTFEIVKGTAIAGDSITIERGQEGTVPRSFVAGDVAELRFTAGIIEAWRQEVDGRVEDAEQAANDAQGIANQKIDKVSGAASGLRYSIAEPETATVTIDLNTDNVVLIDATANPVTVQFSNEPTEQAMAVVVKIKGNNPVTWPVDIGWNKEQAPELGDAFTNVVLFWDGTEWDGIEGAKV